jgi:excisionase family DNA binding protein
MKKSENLYSIREVAALLGVGLNQTYNAARKGDIPTIRLGKRFFVPKTAFETMLNGPNPSINGIDEKAIIKSSNRAKKIALIRKLRECRAALADIIDALEEDSNGTD